MKFDIITLFPDILESYFSVSVVKRAQQKKLVEIKTHQLRDFAVGKHKTVDGPPYGGGAGMVLLVEPILKAIENVQKKNIKKSKVKLPRSKTIIFSAKGKPFTQKLAYEWSKRYNHFLLIAGRYEGIDERVSLITKAQEISMGPYVVTDGDVMSMAFVSAISRLVPKVIKFESLEEESYWNELLKKESKLKENKFITSLEYPHYSRPEEIKYKGKIYRVPKVLLSGNHAKIEEWRAKHKVFYEK